MIDLDWLILISTQWIWEIDSWEGVGKISVMFTDFFMISSI